jgi:hypothetical protein
MSSRRWLLPIPALALALAALAVVRAAPPSGLDAFRQAFEHPPDDARVMMRWWWFGAAMTPAQIERDLAAMKAAGIGGVEIQPVYPLALDEPGGVTNVPYLSDRFQELLRVAGDRAAAHGLRLDLTLGSGWPYGGPTVGITDAASRLRIEKIEVPPGAARVVRPAMTTGESWIGAFVGPRGEDAAVAASMTPLAWPDGAPAAALAPSDRPRHVWAFIAGRTGMQVKRPAVGAEGYVLSHYDRGALDRYLERVGARLLSPLTARPPFAIFCDSLEVYLSDWSPDLAAEFAKRRGYDVVPLLPRLAADRGDEGAMVREDWGRTLTELLDERFIRPLGEWARARGTRLRIQGYGIPPASVSSNAAADLPEGEGHQWRELTASRWASSASHLYDKPVASSETWTWLHSPSFRATPLDLKAEADRHFLQGITQLIGHGWPSTPDGQEEPGWRFYAAGAFNDRNPWWIAMPDLSRYLQRVSAVLRQGRPGNDVALYLPIQDAYAHATPGRMHLLELARERLGADVIGSILDAGYGLDLVDDGALVSQARVQGNAFAIGSGRYRAVVVPGVEAMPEETLAALERFAAAGVALIATTRPPVRPAGRRDAAVREAFRARAAALFSGADGRGAVVPDAHESLRRALNERVPPPIRIAAVGSEPADPTRAIPSDVGVIERRTDDGSLFFVVNASNVQRQLRVGLGTLQRAVEQSDPVRGAASWTVTDARGELTLTLAPYESRFLLRAPIRQTGVPRTHDVFVLPATEAIVVGPWTVRVGGDQWTTASDALDGWQSREAHRYFSGVATYEARVVMPAPDARRGARAWLDFGEGTPLALQPRRNGYRAWLDAPVREAAVVSVNGHVVGSVWTPPYRIEISHAMRPGTNVIQVRVGNTAMNHMAGRALPDYRLLNLRYGERFVPQDMEQVRALPSGLVGRVRVLVERR